MNFEDNFSKNIIINESEGNIENSLNQTLADEILDEEDHRDIRIEDRRRRNLRYRAREREVAIRAPVISLAR